MTWNKIMNNLIKYLTFHMHIKATYTCILINHSGLMSEMHNF